jgi:hypothetical protein
MFMRVVTVLRTLLNVKLRVTEARGNGSFSMTTTEKNELSAFPFELVYTIARKKIAQKD